MDAVAIRMMGALLVGLAATAAPAQEYPSKPLRFVVPFAPGGGVDIVTRTLTARLAEQLKQQIVVDNRPGASGNIGSDLVAKAAPDGYTLLMASPSNVINMTLFPKVPYDVVRDLAAVSLVGEVANLLAAHPSLPARSLQDVLRLAKAKPGQLNFGSGGSGTAQHLSGELLRRMAAVDLVHVPYKGGAPAVIDAVGGQITLVFTNVVESSGHVKSGRLRAIAVTTQERSPALPEVPTFIESGLPGYEVSVWWGVLTANGAPAGAIARLNAEIGKALQAPEVRDRLVGLGARVKGSTPEALGMFIKAEHAKWSKVIRESGIRAD